MMVFNESVLSLVEKIPSGRVSTYKEIAKALGNVGLSRAVGNTLHKNKDLIVIPCHRVVRSDGKIGGYSQGVYAKTELLCSEGIKVEAGRVKGLDRVLFTASDLLSL